MMARYFSFALLVVGGGCADSHDGRSVAGASSHPVLNLHLLEPKGGDMMNGLIEWTKNSEQILDGLEERVEASEAALGNQMFATNSLIHELASIGSSLAHQLRGRTQENLFLIPPFDDATHEIHTLKGRLDSIAHDALASDEGTHPGDDSAAVGFDASSSETAAREKLLNAQNNFASIGGMMESDDEKAVESKLAVAMKSPSHIGHAGVSRASAEVVSRCRVDARTCPKGWSNAGATCVASADYIGPCADKLTLSGMSQEQLHAIAKYCRLQFACQ